MLSAKKTSLAIAAVLFLSSSMVKPVYAIDTNQLIMNVCTAVAANDKTRLRQKLRSASIRLRDIYSGVRCNGETLLRFAMLNNAADAGSFVVGRLPVSDLTQAEFDGLTILQWADKNGQSGSPIVTAVNERIN